ncbi:carboxypeptidase-like regulatory domain-containing protein [Ancylomarina sp. YFZ004]
MKYLILYFFILITFPLLSQEKTSTLSFESASLKEVLNKLESQFDVRFSYRDDIANQYKFSFEISDASLYVIITKLQQETQLIFEKISSRYIIVKEDETPRFITIRGRLVDKTTQTPLWGGTIINQTQKRGCTSDEEGYFELRRNTSVDTILIQYIGFTSIKFCANIIKDNLLIKAELYESHEQLNEVLIDQISDGTGNNYDGSIMLSSDDIKSVTASPDPDVFETLQLIPGVVSPSESNSDLHIRGGTPDQNLILWNGITIYHNSHFFGMISALNPHQISDVKIFRSGASAQYGNRISGVIDMRSDRRIPEQVGGSLGANFNYMDALLKLPIKKDKVGISLSFRRSYNDFIKTPSFNHYSERVFQNTIISENKAFDSEYTKTNTDFYFKDLSLNTTINFSDDHKLYVNYLYSINDLDYSFSYDDYYKSKDRLKINNQGLSLISEGKWSRNVRHSIKGEFSYYDLDYSYHGEIDNGEKAKNTKANSIKELGLDADVQVRLGPWSKLRTGLQITSQTVEYHFQSVADASENNYIDKNKGDENSFALYSELQFNKKKDFYINLGLRFNYLTSTEKMFFEPRLYAKLKLAKPLYFKLTASIKNQNISQILEFQTSDFGLENQVWGLADNLNIPILNSKQISGGLEWDKDGLNIGLETYFKQDEGLTSVSKAFVNKNVFYAEGKSKTWGFDALFRKRGQNYNSLLSYSLIKTNYRFLDLNEGKTFRGNFDIRHAVAAAFTYHWQSFEFSLNWKWRTGKPFTPANSIDPENGQIYYDIINSSRISNYHRLDFSSAYKFSLSDSSKRQLKLGFNLQNLYDKKNVLDRSYMVYYDETYQMNELKSYSLGITPNVFVRYEF